MYRHYTGYTRRSRSGRAIIATVHPSLGGLLMRFIKLKAENCPQ